MQGKQFRWKALRGTRPMTHVKSNKFMTCPWPLEAFHDVSMACWSFPWPMTCCLWNSLTPLRWCSCSCCWIRTVMMITCLNRHDCTVMMMTCLSRLLNRRLRAMEDLASGEWSLLFFRYSRFPQSVRLVSRHRTQIFGRFPRQLGKGGEIRF